MLKLRGMYNNAQLDGITSKSRMWKWLSQLDAWKWRFNSLPCYHVWYYLEVENVEMVEPIGRVEVAVQLVRQLQLILRGAVKCM